MVKKILIITGIFLIFLISFYIIKTYKVLKTFNYVILVKKDSKIKKRNLKKVKVGYLIQDESLINNANLTYESFYDISSMVTSLKKDKIGAMILDKNLINLFPSDLEDISILSIYKTKDQSLGKNNFTIYISGTDTFSNTSSRTDVNMVVLVNTIKHKILLISIPRDYYIPFKNSHDKLTHISIYGIDKTMDALANYLNIDIDYYINVNFKGFIDIIDLLGGIDVYSSTSFTSKDGYKYIKGNNKLSGKQALSFVRERYAFIEGDKKRLVNEQEVIKSIIDKISSLNILFNYGKYLNIIKDNVITNISEDLIVSLVKDELKNNNKWDIETYTLDGKDSYEYTYTYPFEKLYVMIPNKDSLSDKIKEMGE